jgi:hypothetical protein
MEGHIPNDIPPFGGNNYAYWSKKMKTFLTTLGVDIFLSVFNCYKVPKNTLIDLDENNLLSCNSKDWHAIIIGLRPTVSSKVMGCHTTKEVG